jgi:hypothetical protein
MTTTLKWVKRLLAFALIFAGLVAVAPYCVRIGGHDRRPTWCESEMRTLDLAFFYLALDDRPLIERNCSNGVLFADNLLTNVVNRNSNSIQRCWQRWWAAGKFLDPWGSPYRFYLSLRATTNETDAQSLKLTIRSFGPNTKDDGGRKDDITMPRP